MINRIILSAGIVLLAGGLVVGGLLIYDASSPAPEADSANITPQAEDVLTLEDPPDYGSCDFVTTEAVRESLGSAARGVQPGISSGAIGPNSEPAHICTFPFTTNQSSDNSLTVTVYRAGATIEAQKGDQMDASWAFVSDSQRPSYFKMYEDGSTTKFALRLLMGATNYQLTIAQPKNMETLNYSTAMIGLQQLSNKGDYTAASAALPDPTTQDTP